MPTNGSYPLEPDRLDPRAVRFWSSTSLAALAKEPPATALFAQVRDYAIWRGPRAYADLFGMPNFEAVRREVHLSRSDSAQSRCVSFNTVLAIELGWKRLSLGSTLILCERYGVPLAAIYHDRDFHARPMLNTYESFGRDETGEVHL